MTPYLHLEYGESGGVEQITLYMYNVILCSDMQKLCCAVLTSLGGMLGCLGAPAGVPPSPSSVEWVGPQLGRGSSQH